MENKTLRGDDEEILKDDFIRTGINIIRVECKSGDLVIAMILKAIALMKQKNLEYCEKQIKEADKFWMEKYEIAVEGWKNGIERGQKAERQRILEMIDKMRIDIAGYTASEFIEELKKEMMQNEFN